MRARERYAIAFQLTFVLFLGLSYMHSAATTTFAQQTCEDTATTETKEIDEECGFQTGLLMPINRDMAIATTDPKYCPCDLKHIVTFKFKEGTTKEQIDEVRRRFMELQTKCLLPNGTQYIKSVVSGFQHSYEGAHRDQEIGFIVSFKSQGDRNYYVGEPMLSAEDSDLFDPVHAEFKTFVGPLLDFDSSIPAFVFDFCA